MPAARIEAPWARTLSGLLTGIETSLTDLAHTLGVDPPLMAGAAVQGRRSEPADSRLRTRLHRR